MGITSFCLSSTSLAFFICFLGVVLSSPQQNNGNNNNSPTRSPFAKSPKEQPCSSNEQCNSWYPNSQCKNGITCECMKEHVEYEGRCIPVIPMYGDLAVTPPCEADIQCAADLQFSRCNPDTKICECFDRNSNGRNATAHWRGYCYIKTGLGQGCVISEACRASISPPADVECDVKTRTCKCKEGKTCEDLKGNSPHVSAVPSLTLFLSGIIAFKVFV